MLSHFITAVLLVIYYSFWENSTHILFGCFGALHLEHSQSVFRHSELQFGFLYAGKPLFSSFFESEAGSV